MRLSIITINYNNVAGLQKTIESVLSQEFKNYEWIVIDGGSTDGSVELLNRYKSKFSYLISQPDNGIYNAMNKGIGRAIGEYCFFLNSGDYLADNKVLEIVFATNPIEDILFGNLYVTLNGKVVEKAYGKEALTFSDIYNHIIKHQASFINRNLFTRFGNYNEKRKIVADWEFFIKTIGLNNVLYRYINTFITYFDNNGISNQSADLTIKERQQVIQENIPSMMQPDYEFLLNYKKYERLYKNSFSFICLRLLNKIIQFIDSKNCKR